MAAAADRKGEAPAEDERSSWAPLDLKAVIARGPATSGPELVARVDGPCLLYPGKVHSLYGEPESGKGWFALVASAEQLGDGKATVYIDLEDSPETTVSRLRRLAQPKKAILERFRYVRPEESIKGNWADLAKAFEPTPALVVIDGMTEALALEGIDLNSNSDVAAWIATVPRQIARDTGAAVLIIDHQRKDPDARSRFAIGAQHKLAGVDVAFSIKTIRAFGIGRTGTSKIKVEKDRPGHLRKDSEQGLVAELRVTSTRNSESVVAALLPLITQVAILSSGWSP